jgi:hypothetical protein
MQLCTVPDMVQSTAVRNDTTIHLRAMPCQRHRKRCDWAAAVYYYMSTTVKRSCTRVEEPPASRRRFPETSTSLTSLDGLQISGCVDEKACPPKVRSSAEHCPPGRGVCVHHWVVWKGLWDCTHATTPAFFYAAEHLWLSDMTDGRDGADG